MAYHEKKKTAGGDGPAAKTDKEEKFLPSFHLLNHVASSLKSTHIKMAERVSLLPVPVMKCEK